jgi:type IV pilus assembly protein PilC
MPVYLWTGKNRKGETQKGEMDAANENAVRNHLTRLKITPVRIKKKPKDLMENISFLQPKV